MRAYVPVETCSDCPLCDFFFGKKSSKGKRKPIFKIVPHMKCEETKWEGNYDVFSGIHPDCPFTTGLPWNN